MSRFTSTADVQEFAADLWTLQLQAQMEELLVGAARAFLIAAAGRIPVRTGFLRGSLNNLADAAAPVTVPPIIPTVTRREYYRHNGAGGRVLKTPESGRQFSTAPGDIFSRQKRDALGRKGGNIQKANIRATGIYTFDFEDIIKYLDINDRRRGWNSWQTGANAFDAYINANFQAAVPSLSKFTLTSRIISNGTTVRQTKGVGG
jgi:hypothetical protein